MPNRVAMVSTLVAAALATAIAARFRWAPPLWLTLLVALGLRVLVAWLAFGHTPFDVAFYFRRTGELVSAGQDPLQRPPPYSWNFLPTMPYVWAVLQHLGLPWEVLVKIPTIAADLGNTVLVAALAPDRKRLRALQYAVNPLALLVTSWHGQIEPIVLFLGLAALVLQRRTAGPLPGALIGLAVSAKTWPVLFALGLLRRTRSWRGHLAALIAVVAVPLVIFLTMPLALRADLVGDARHIAGYRSYVGWWGWSGLVRLRANPLAYGYRLDATFEQHLGAILTAAAVLLVVVIWRHSSADVLMTAVFLTFLVTTAGFGPQYLMWPLPLLIARPTWRSWPFLWLAAGYAATFYLTTIPRTHVHWLIYGSLPVVAAAALALPVRSSKASPATIGVPAPARSG